MYDIKLNKLCTMALSKKDGMMIREQIQKALESYEKVTVDFEGITKFATPFFNSCFAYFILELSPEEYQNRIFVCNLTALGEKSYDRATQNAKNYYSLSSENKIDINDIINSADI